jgi:hypothetical protein
MGVGGFDPSAEPEQFAAHLIAAAQLLETTSDSLQAAAREPFSARALFALWMLDTKEQNRRKQLAHLRTFLPLYQEVQKLQDAFWALHTEEHLPLFDLCLASIASLSPAQRTELGELISELRTHLSADAYRAYCLGSVVLRHVDVDATHRRRSPKMLVKDAVETTVAVLARQGHQSRSEAEAAFSKGCLALSKRGQGLSFPPDSALSVQSLDAALITLSVLPTKTRKALLDASEIVAQHDYIIEPSEAELLRVIAVSLDLATPLRGLSRAHLKNADPHGRSPSGGE